MNLTQARLKQLLHYNHETGVFTRIGASRPQTRGQIGQEAGYIKRGGCDAGGGYVMVPVDGVVRRAHRLAWLYMTGEDPVGADIDHRDGDRANNRWANLRLATRSQNIGNSKLSTRNKSGIKGVRWDKSRGKWLAQIGIGKCAKGYYYTKHLGRFDSKEDAAAAYRVAAERLFGEFARAA